MSEIVGREVKRWSETLEELNEYDITLVNILLKHYEDLIEAGGTAGGKRTEAAAGPHDQSSVVRLPERLLSRA